MENQPSNILAEISDADWQSTPERVKRLVGKLMERIVALEQRQEHLEELLKRNSKNTSQPPSQDAPQGFKPKPKATEQKKRGGQAGHEGHSAKLYKSEECAELKSIIPAIVAPVGRG
jgi:hypothetical protein